MDQSDSQLASQCADTAAAADKAAAWVSDNKTGIGAQSQALARVLRQKAELARKYQRAATRPLCIGIFGPSQAGKSYLVSALARKGTNPLIAMLDRERDFLKEINPQSGQEATGLVTRFSIHPTGATAGHPVAVRLLNHIDLVKILANTYFLDFKPAEEREVSPEEINQALAEAQRRAQGDRVDNLADVEIEDLRIYCEDRFGARKTIEALAGGYWTQLEELAPRLPVAERVKLLSFLWGRLPELTAVYVSLYQVLSGLGFAQEAYCPIQALVPRHDSILDVNTLKGITNPTGASIEVVGINGRRLAVPRAYLTAIVAELLIQIKEAPWEFFNHTDVLDFPGARSRKQYGDPENFVKNEDAIFDLFRRGKVAYLFDRYSEEREITGMLLCMVPGNQEVQTLPEMVLSWIHKSHGETPAERGSADTTLFLVLTKFDEHFLESKGQAKTSEARWTGSITTALTDFYGKSRDNWPLEWQPGKPFRNCFWLRNPNFIARGLIAYGDGDEHRETGVCEPARIAQFKREYLANAMIKTHFNEPEMAWDAAFSLNDGGISYLAQALVPVCKPELKRSQILARLNKLRRDLVARLEEFHVSDDRSVEEKKRAAAAQKAQDSLLNVVDDQRFGHLLREFQVNSDDLQLLFNRTKLAGDTRPPDGPRISRSRIKMLLGMESADSTGKSEVHDRYTDFAAVSLVYWADRLEAVSRQSQILNFLRMDPETVETIVRELLAGSERVSLSAEIARDMRATNPGIDETLKPAMASAEKINRYVWRLGQDALKLSERATVSNNGRPAPVFKPREPVDSIDGLPEDGEAYLLPFVADWLSSFVQLAKMNSKTDLKQKFSPEESRRLTGIMQQLGA
jgi:hypothetical protein